MTRPATRALGFDALYQVLDNGVFRILAVAALIPVLVFCAVQVTPDELRILWGMWSWPLDEVAPFLGAREGAADFQAAVLGSLLDIVFFALAGTFGVLFVLAATSFFVPRMLEKGAADVLFHKPVSRLRFFLSRYVAGLLFVFILALVSATGVFLALSVFSGFSDVGVFAMVPALTYLFGIIFPVTMLIGVLTRSTVASILLSAVFFMANGCVHGLWMQRESGAFEVFDEMASERDAVTVETEGDDGATSSAVELPDEDSGSKWDILWTALDVAHFALPKTSAVPHLTSKMRKAALRPAWVHPGSTLQVGRLPDGWSLVPDEQLADPLLVTGALGTKTDSPSGLGPAAVGARSADDQRMRLHLRPVRELEIKRSNGSIRIRAERVSDVTDALLERLSASEGVESPTEVEYERWSRMRHGPNADAPTVDPDDEEQLPVLSLGPGLTGDVVSWTESSELGPVRVRALIFKSRDEIGTLLHRSSDLQPIDEGFQEVVSKIGHGDPDSAYGKLLRFDAGWRTNIFQSVGSSILFVIVILALGAWRLSRIDF